MNADNSTPSAAGRRQDHEKNILRMSQMYCALSRSNRAIAHDRKRGTLFADICRIAVETGNFSMAWIGLLDKASGEIRPAMQEGGDESMLQQQLEPATVAGAAIREGRTYICNDLSANTGPEPAPAIPGRARSMAALPLHEDHDVAGALVLYTDEAGFFTPALVEPLEEMAQDIFFALQKLADDEKREAMAQALRESEERWSFALDGSGNGVWDWNTRTNQMVYSSGYWTILGFAPGEADATVEDFDARMHPEDKPGVLDSTVQLFRGEVPNFCREYRLQCKDGSYKWVLSRGKVVSRSADGQPVRVIGTIEDITARKSAEADLQLAAQVFQRSIEAIIVTDRDNVILSVNPAFTGVTGYTPDEVIGQNPRMFSSGRHDRAFYQNMWSSLRTTGYWRGEIWNRRKNGDIYPEWLSITAVRDDSGQVSHHIAMFSDISESKRTEERIHQLANYDALTGLPNRLLLEKHLEQAIASAKRHHSQLALLSLDLDHLKKVNQEFGNLIGDQLLQQAAYRLLECVRRGQDTVARQRSDKFLVLLPDLGMDDMMQLVPSIISGLLRPYSLEGREITVRPTIGISLFPTDGNDAVTLIGNAEAAMYHAKSSGRSGYQFFAPEMNARSLQRMTLESSLRRALEQEEFLVHYLPQVDLKSGLVVGAEALLRWQHPEMGMVSPRVFIEMAEESGVIVPLGEWMTHNVCRQIQAWQQADVRIMPISINISFCQFRQFRQIEDIIRESGIDPFFLEIELTESTVMHDVDETAQVIRRIKQQGIRVAVDNFGVGYSTLAYLKRFHIDKLKIDQSFIRELVNSADDSAIVRAIISMAHSLRLEVVAKGVETQKQLDFLKALNCDQIQGYLFSEALPPEGFAALLLEKKRLA